MQKVKGRYRWALPAASLVLLLGTISCSSPSQQRQASAMPQANVSKRLFVDGLFGQVHVRVATPPESAAQKPALVLFHPSPYSSDYFKSFLPEMARDRVVIAMDTPGYGDSERPPEPPSIADYAKNAEMVLNAFGITGPVDMLGYHTGTLIAAEFAVKYPARVNRLILPGVPYFTGDAREKALQENAKPDVLTQDGGHLDSKWEFSTQAMKSGMTLLRGQEHFSDALQAVPESGHAYYGVFTYPSDVQFPKIRQPALFIATAGSLRKETKAASEITPGAQLIYLDGYTDGIFDLAVKELTDITRSFLDSETSRTE